MGTYREETRVGNLLESVRHPESSMALLKQARATELNPATRPLGSKLLPVLPLT